jgi:hypothetical protein
LASASVMTCTICGRVGHLALNCRKRKFTVLDTGKESYLHLYTFI